MRARGIAPVLALLVTVLTLVPASAYMKEGVAKGVIITVGEDRVVVALDEGGQTTFEAANVKQGEEWVKDTTQLALIKALKRDQKVEVEWGQDHTGHYYIRSIARLDLDGRPIPDVPKEGRVRGTVITVGEERLAIRKQEGGQLTLEPGWVQVEGKWGRNKEQIAFFRTLKPGDRIEASWKLDEGTHYCVQSIARVDAQAAHREGQEHGADVAAQVRALREEISALRHEVAALREMITKLLEQKR